MFDHTYLRLGRSHAGVGSRRGRVVSQVVPGRRSGAAARRVAALRVETGKHLSLTKNVGRSRQMKSWENPFGSLGETLEFRSECVCSCSRCATESLNVDSGRQERLYSLRRSGLWRGGGGLFTRRRGGKKTFRNSLNNTAPTPNMSHRLLKHT